MKNKNNNASSGKTMLALRTFGISFFCTVFLLSNTPLALAKDSSTKITLGIMALAPYGFKDTNGQWKGNWLEISHALAKRSNIKMDINVRPVARLTHQMGAGTLDCIIAAEVPFTEERYSRVARVGYSLEFGVLPAKGIELNSYDDLKNIAIAVSLGTKMGLPFDEDTSLQKVQTRDYLTAIKMLERKRVDAVVGVLSSLKYSSKLAGQENVKFGKPFVFKTLPINFYCMPNSQTKIYWPKIKETLSGLNEDGTIRRILNRY
ncbi:MAG: transporter substrate-binding domain-containing protein [Rhodospirillales bacterium]|nr:transporter substrate-binding domain-containing protein [Rhodospirillales bacterium]